jgi:C4-dicarboxylate transporter DctM subunit
MFLGIPVAFSILAACSSFLVITDIRPLLLVGQRMTTGLDSFPLLAVPLFLLVGNLMERGGISRRLVDWTQSFVGALPGGIGAVAIVSCAIFAALTGSGPATVAAIGSIIIPSMEKHGYSKETAGGLIAAAGALGPIIPPSIPMIIYGVCMSVSVPGMFIAGILPGIFIMFALIVVNTIIAFRNESIRICQINRKYTWKERGEKTWKALGALLLPVIILGGIYAGIFTPTEAASVGVVYSLFVGFAYKELKIGDLPKVILSSMETSAMVALIMASANVLTWIVSATQTGPLIVNFLLQFFTSKTLYIIVLNLFLFFVGALMDTIASIIILAPILAPIGIAMGINPLHMSMIFVINLVIGMVTPPFGYNLYMAISITGLKFNKLVRGVLPFVIVEMFCVMVIAFWEDISLFLPRLLGFL